MRTLRSKLRLIFLLIWVGLSFETCVDSSQVTLVPKVPAKKSGLLDLKALDYAKDRIAAMDSPLLVPFLALAQEENKALDLKVLDYAKDGIAAMESPFLVPFLALAQEASKAMELKAPSVMDKSMTPPSGDKHDYTSMSPYWWPDPDSKDGLPYIRRDGEVNPERNAFDKIPGAIMSEAVRACVLMFYFTGEELYSEKAAELMRTWFLDPATRMNPHLNFGQFVPGRSDGRSVGIIESRNFVFLTDYERLLSSSTHWSVEDHEGFVVWMNHFLDWLLESKLGQKERAHTNNHGSWYDFQVLALSQYCDRLDLGMEIANNLNSGRLTKQITESGEQPEELARTKSFNYSVFNLSALINSAILAENYGILLYDEKQSDSRLKAGIEFLIPFTLETETWPYTQISGMDGAKEGMIMLLSYLNARHAQPNYEDAFLWLNQKFPGSRQILTTTAYHNNAIASAAQKK